MDERFVLFGWCPDLQENSDGASAVVGMTTVGTVSHVREEWKVKR